MGWLALRWLLTGAAGLVVAGWFVGIAAIAWQRDEIKQLTGERDGLATEIASLQTQADAWAKAGGRAHLQKCGDAKRLCVRVEKKTPYGQKGDYFVLSGY